MSNWAEFSEKASWYGMFCCGCIFYAILALIILATGFGIGALIFHY